MGPQARAHACDARRTDAPPPLARRVRV
jgi:hypothetical protein